MVGVPLAVSVKVVLIVGGAGWHFFGGSGPWEAFGALYLAINIVYSLGVKRVVLIDVLVVATGYVIRAVAGAVAIDVTPSPWLFATTAAGALFIVLGRRYAEVRLAGDGAADQRSVLSKYAGPFIGQLLIISATSAWLSYTLYTVEADNLPQNNTMLLTLPVVTFALFRYLYLLNTSEDAEAPEQLIARDLPLVPLHSELGSNCGSGVDSETTIQVNRIQTGTIGVSYVQEFRSADQPAVGPGIAQPSVARAVRTLLPSQRAVVAIVATRPETVLDDVQRAMVMAGITQYLDPELTTLLKINIFVAILVSRFAPLLPGSSMV